MVSAQLFWEQWCCHRPMLVQLSRQTWEEESSKEWSDPQHQWVRAKFEHDKVHQLELLDHESYLPNLGIMKTQVSPNFHKINRSRLSSTFCVPRTSIVSNQTNKHWNLNLSRLFIRLSIIPSLKCCNLIIMLLNQISCT